MEKTIIFQGNREGLESVTRMNLGNLLEQQRFTQLAIFFFFKFSCSFCAKVNNFSEAGKQGWNNHKSQADKYCGKQICFQVPFFFCWSYKLHVTNVRMLQCRWAHVNKMPTFISPSVDPRQASPEANSPPKVDASTWPEESHPKICD